VISCGSRGEELCKRIDLDINVVFVYIFAMNVERHSKWAPKYYKIQGVFTLFEDLMRSIKK
jgi:hypothetical protein